MLDSLSCFINMIHHQDTFVFTTEFAEVQLIYFLQFKSKQWVGCSITKFLALKQMFKHQKAFNKYGLLH